MTSVIISVIDIFALCRDGHIDLIRISTSGDHSQISRDLIGSFGSPTDIVQVTKSVNVDCVDETEGLGRKRLEDRFTNQLFESIVKSGASRYQPWCHQKILDDRGEHMIWLKLMMFGNKM